MLPHKEKLLGISSVDIRDARGRLFFGSSGPGLTTQLAFLPSWEGPALSFDPACRLHFSWI